MNEKSEHAEFLSITGLAQSEEEALRARLSKRAAFVSAGDDLAKEAYPEDWQIPQRIAFIRGFIAGGMKADK